MAEKFFGTKISKAGIPVQQATDRQLIYKDNFTTKVYYDNANSRIVEGKLPDGNYGLWVSKPGFNADDKDAAIQDNLIFNSNNDIFRIVLSGTASINIPAYPWSTNPIEQDSISIPHNLGYTPVPLVYVSDPAGLTYSLAGGFTMNQSQTNWWVMNNRSVIGIDDTKLDILVQQIGWYKTAVPAGNLNTATTLFFKYYLLQEILAP
jgi:hypothetical protein